MPIKNGATGAWGGFVQGLEGAQAFTKGEKVNRGLNLSNAGIALDNVGKKLDHVGKRTSNARDAYEFLEFMDTAKERRNILKGKSSSADIIQQTADSTIDETNARNAANQQTAERALALKEEKLYAERMALQNKAQTDMLGMHNDQINYMAKTLAPLGEEGTPGYGDITDETYGSMLNQMKDVFGENADKIFEQYGITENMTEQSINGMKAIRTTAVHNVGIQQEEHMARLKGQIDLKIAAAKAMGSYDAKSTIGKLLQDQSMAMQEAMNMPPGSMQQQRAIASYELYETAIKSLMKEETAKADEAATGARDLTLKSNFPRLGTEFEAGNADAQVAWAKLVKMQDFLRNSGLSEEQTMTMLSRWYRFENNTIFSDELILREPQDVLRSSARVSKIMRQMLDTAETAAGFAAMKDEELGQILLDIDRQSKLEAENKVRQMNEDNFTPPSQRIK